MSLTRKQVGAMGERLAVEHLKKCSYKIIDTNFRSHDGEIDIIAIHGDCLVFVEVRTKTSLYFGSPQESITNAKMQKLKSLAAAYQQTHNNLPEQWRIDVVAIQMNENSRLSRIELIENAVPG